MLDLNQYKLIVESSPNMIWRANTTTECDYFNQTWLRFTGRTLEQELGFGWAAGVHPEDYADCVQQYLDHFNRREPFSINYRLLRHDGQYRWLNDRGVPFYDEQGEFLGFIGSCMDITEKVEGQSLKDMARHDGLSKLFNRQYAFQLLAQEFKAVSPEAPLVMLMMDIDNFKDVNDTHGHQAGDRVLEYVASVIRDKAGKRGIAGRYGGDEFVIGLPRASVEEAAEIAAEIKNTVQDHCFEAYGRAFSVTMSAGIAQSGGELTMEELVYLADSNLYHAKFEGKNRIKW